MHQKANIKGYAPAVGVFRSNQTATELSLMARKASILVRISKDARGFGGIKIYP
jgi:hypothetical protein